VTTFFVDDAGRRRGYDAHAERPTQE